MKLDLTGVIICILMITKKIKRLFTYILTLLVSSFAIPCQVFACFSISFILSFLFNLHVSLHMLDTISQLCVLNGLPILFIANTSCKLTVYSQVPFSYYNSLKIHVA